MPLVATRGGASAFGLGWSASADEELGGMVLLTPTSISYTGTSATVGTNGSVEFTACSSLSLNGVFSADYDNYMIAVRHEASVASGFALRLRDSVPSDESGTNYASQLLEGNGSTVGASRYTSLTTLPVGDSVAGQKSGHVIHLYGPYLAKPTGSRSISEWSVSAAGIADYAAIHSLSTSYVGFTVIKTSGNFSGLVSVYGLVGA